MVYAPPPLPPRPTTHIQPKKPRKLFWALVGVVGVVVLLAVIGSLSSTGDSTPRTAAGAPIVPSTAAVQPVPADVTSAPTLSSNSVPGDGVYEVGTDIKPGKYKSPGPTNDIVGCYYARKNSAGVVPPGGSNYIHGQVVVTIKSTDAEFETQGCQPWVKVG